MRITDLDYLPLPLRVLPEKGYLAPIVFLQKKENKLEREWFYTWRGKTQECPSGLLITGTGFIVVEDVYGDKAQPTHIVTPGWEIPDLLYRGLVGHANLMFEPHKLIIQTTCLCRLSMHEYYVRALFEHI